jgi:hypothetical protein
MIYQYPDHDAPIRQGDIFIGLPRTEISLREVILVGEAGERLARWEELAEQNQSLRIIVPVRSVPAIVATQDCDTLHSRDITLCEIRKFADVEGKAAQTTSHKAWKNIITQHARINQKWFYLPPDQHIGINEKMAVDFMVTLRIPREDLELLRSLRKGRLNPVADEHFRERISEFFRRYPYDEWYSLNKEELDAYRSEYPDAEPFPWQGLTAGQENRSS